MMNWHHPILSCSESKAFEDLLFAEDPQKAAMAMETAGKALGKALIRDLGVRLASQANCLLLLGKGHNAGDALVAANLLLDELENLSVDVVPLLGHSDFSPAVEPWWELLIARENVRICGMDVLNPSLDLRYQLSLDGVFGMQFRPPLSEKLRVLFGRINTLQINTRVAVDLPSGLSDCEREIADSDILRADFTYATGICKLPVVKTQNLARVGRLRYLDIGFFDAPFEKNHEKQRVVHAGIFEKMHQLRAVDSDKRSYGHLLIVAGSRNMPGALLMAARAAIRSGVGLVTAVAPESVVAQFAAVVPEAMWMSWSETEHGGLALEGFSRLQDLKSRITGLLVGPGCGVEHETQALLDEVIDFFDVPVVLDADALTRERVARLTERSESIVMTPHEGEFRRIAGVGKDFELSHDFFLQFTEQFTNAFSVLKGPLTKLTDGELIYVFPMGNPILARGGSGDILAGLIAGKIAGAEKNLLLEAVAQGISIHANAADRLLALKEETHVQTTEILNYLNLY